MIVSFGTDAAPLKITPPGSASPPLKIKRGERGVMIFFRSIGYNKKYMRNLSDLADSLLHRGLLEIDNLL